MQNEKCKSYIQSPPTRSANVSARDDVNVHQYTNLRHIEILVYCNRKKKILCI